MLPPHAINWYYYPSVRISVTQEKSMSFRSALYYLEFYINAMIVQWNRLCADSAGLKGLGDVDLQKNVQAANARYQIMDLSNFDTQFYLICLDKIDKYSAVLIAKSDDTRIKKIWKNIKPLTEKASAARNFFEHLDRSVKEEREGFPRTQGFFPPAGMFFKYVDISKKGKKFERELLLGIKEVKSIMKAYDDTLRSLGAKINGYQSQGQ